MKIALMCAFILVGACLCVSADPPATSPPTKSDGAVVAMVNGAPITFGEIDDEATVPRASFVDGKFVLVPLTAQEAHASQVSKLARLIREMVSNDVQSRLAITVSPDELQAFTDHELKMFDPATIVAKMHAQADQLDACLKGATAVYEQQVDPDDAYDKYVKTKADEATWQATLPTCATQALRDTLAKRIATQRALTVESFSSPENYASDAARMKFTLVIVNDIATTHPDVKTYADGLTWPVDMSEIVQTQPQSLPPLLNDWWKAQYKRARIAIIDHDYDDVLVQLQIAPPPPVPPIPAGQKPVRFTMRYFRDVVSKKRPDNRYSISPGAQAGVKVYAFYDRSTKLHFHDGAHVIAAAGNLRAHASSSPIPGGQRYKWPKALTGGAIIAAPSYLTRPLLHQAAQLAAELNEYNRLIANSPLVIDGHDVESTATASLAENGRATEPVITFTLTSKGAKKFADFTLAHKNEIIAIIADDRVLGVPTIEGAILDGKVQISGGFRSLAEAQSLAAQINQGASPSPPPRPQ